MVYPIYSGAENHLIKNVPARSNYINFESIIDVGATLSIYCILGCDYSSYRYGFDDTLTIFGQSLAIDIRPFITFLSYVRIDDLTKRKTGHAVSVEKISIFEGSGDDSSTTLGEKIWYYAGKRAVLTNTQYTASPAELAELYILKQKIEAGIEKEPVEQHERLKQLLNEETEDIFHYQLYHSNTLPSGYITVKDSHKITNQLPNIFENDKVHDCLWEIPIKQFYKIVASTITVTLARNVGEYQEFIERIGYKFYSSINVENSLEYIERLLKFKNDTKKEVKKEAKKEVKKEVKKEEGKLLF
jgi:hypothetical protein